MYATVRINMENAAFDDAPERELAQLLRQAAEKIEGGLWRERALFDGNGNRVGVLKIHGSRGSRT